MDENARQLSLTVESCSRALAEWTVTRHAELDATLARRYGSQWRRDWVEDTRIRIRYLGQALAVQRPELFEHTVVWAGRAYTARAMDLDDLANNLRAMREIIEAELPEGAVRPALACLDRALPRLSGLAAAPVPESPVTGPHRQLLLEYLETVLSGRRTDAERLATNAVNNGTGVREIYRHVLQPAQVEIGSMWHRGEISVADEHFATETTQAIMAQMRTRFERNEPRGRCLVATSVGGDLHSLGVRMVADFFELDGWNVICLGADTPAADLVRGVLDHEAHLLGLSASSGLSIRTVGEVIDAIRGNERLSHLKVLVGGPALSLVPDLWKDLGADGFAPTAEEAVEIGNRLVDGGSIDAA